MLPIEVPGEVAQVQWNKCSQQGGQQVTRVRFHGMLEKKPVWESRSARLGQKLGFARSCPMMPVKIGFSRVRKGESKTDWTLE